MTTAPCTCGKTHYAWHNPTCKRHPIPLDGSPCECCGVSLGMLSPADQRLLRARAAAEQAQP